MTISPSEWHDRFKQQASWTQSIRNYIFQQIDLETCQQILDVGCGTGALETEFFRYHNPGIFGIDINTGYLKLAQLHAPNGIYIQADAYAIPYPDNTFNLSFCHFLLLWVSNPISVIHEMIRVTKPGGIVAAFAEPDYGGRIDYPTKFEKLGEWQIQSLREQKAEPMIGRRLSKLFHNSELTEIEIGVFSGQWSESPSQESWESEWAILLDDLNKIPHAAQNNRYQELLDLKSKDWEAWESGERILFVPTFYAWGIKK
jgi:ubiquinone/menaquinone biosynthesis C-methylase UbiE